MIEKLRFDRFSALYLLGAFIVIFGVWTPDKFLQWRPTGLSVLTELVIGLVLAVAFLIPLTTATYDLSVARTMTISIGISTWLAKNTEIPDGVTVVIALLACVVVGVANGFLVVKLKIDSFIATLGMTLLLDAVAIYIAKQVIAGAWGDNYLQFGRTKLLFDIPMYVIFVGLVMVAAWYVLEHTPVGRKMFAVGGNPDAARLSGVATDRLIWGSLVASALLGGFAGTIHTWRVGTYENSVGPGFLFPAIAAVFFGAVQFKNRPNVWGTVVAALALAVGVKGLRLTFPTADRWLESLFNGLSLLIAVAFASRYKIIKAPKRLRKRERTDTSSSPAETVDADSG